MAAVSNNQPGITGYPTLDSPQGTTSAGKGAESVNMHAAGALDPASGVSLVNVTLPSGQTVAVRSDDLPLPPLGFNAALDHLGDRVQQLQNPNAAEQLKAVIGQLQSIEAEVQNGQQSVVGAGVKLANALDNISIGMAQQQDQASVNKLVSEYQGSDAADKAQTLKSIHAQASGYAERVLENLRPDLARASESEQTTLKQQMTTISNTLSTISTDNSFDLSSLLLQIMSALDEIRKLAAKTKAREREASLTLQLASANDTRKVGEERMIASVLSGALTIASGTISLGGAAGAGLNANRLFAKGTEIATDKAKTFTQAIMGFTGGVADATKAAGELGSGIQQVVISDEEAKGKEHDAYAQGAGGRAEAAQKMIDDMQQQILKVIDGMQQMRSGLNQSASGAINRIA